MPEVEIDYFEDYPLGSLNPYEKRPKSLKGPLRVVRLCVFGIVIPALLIGLPLYMRYRVYGHQFYPLAMSDMRMLDNRVSTTWCQKQHVKTNATFNAYLLPEAPRLASGYKTLSMVRHLMLEDDTKEYWGFYLLKGSSVTVSTCVRWPGASLIVIRGHKHLHECAYIGDDSSEELDEIMEAIREGTYVSSSETVLNNTLLNGTESEEQPVNQPNLMKRHRPGVKFHHPFHEMNKQNYTIQSSMDATEITDASAMERIYKQLQMKKNKKKNNILISSTTHTRRNQSIAKGETGYINIQSPRQHQSTSQELLNDMLKKLQGFGDRGSEILEKLNVKFKNSSDTREEPQSIGTMGRHYSKPAMNYSDMIDNDSRRRRRRRRRDLFPNVYKDLNENDSENDQGGEEGFSPKPDGIADYRGFINETTLNDMSNSEFWSSFSSSEEALLNCEGLILNLPLEPHHKCKADLTEDEARETYLANSITYRVPMNGYYFFVFNSENEVQTNYIRVQFHLDKAVYNVSNPVSYCINATQACSLDLNFFSSEKLVLELPVHGNETLWNEEFVVMSECEPRSAIYATCVIIVPILVVLVAFS